MKILGIIAEYDPFHLGHERHLRMAREAVAPDETLVVLSGCFRQRGDLAMFSPRDRAACALEAGADAVFALPVLRTLRSAEDYAYAAVSLLNDLGCTHLSFGAEESSPDLLRAAAELLENPSPSFTRALQEELSRGTGYPHALECALGGAFGAEGKPLFTPEEANRLSLPNNTLAICYLRALLRLRSPMIPVPVPRSGAYRADRVDPFSPSASALREALRRGAWEQALPALSPRSREILSAAMLYRRFAREEVLSSLLLSRLRTMSPEEAALLPDLSEGLENRLLKEAVHARSRQELLERVSSRRYSIARVSRLCACALLGITRQETVEAPEKGPEALLLALRPRADMTRRWRGLNIPVLSSLKDTKNPPLWRADLLSWKIWALCAGLPDTLPNSERIYTPENP